MSATSSEPPEYTMETSGDQSRLPPLPLSPMPAAVQRTTSLPPPQRRPRGPTMTHHQSRSLIIPTPDILSSVAGGAHYAGAFSTHDKHIHSPGLDKHTRSLSLPAGDPILEEKYRAVMEDLQELFCGRPTLEIFERRWRKDAEFEYPWGKCVGFSEYAPQFFALPKICARSNRIAIRILSATVKPNRLVLSQTQEYTFRFFGSKKVVNSFLLVDLDDNFKIIRLVDQWNGEDPSTRWVTLMLRKLNAKLMPWFVHVPKFPTSATTSAA